MDQRPVCERMDVLGSLYLEWLFLSTGLVPSPHPTARLLTGKQYYK